MLKVLLKKQISEVFKGYFYDSKKNKKVRINTANPTDKTFAFPTEVLTSSGSMGISQPFQRYPKAIFTFERL